MPNFKQRVLRAIGQQHWIPRGRDGLIRLLDNPDGHASDPFETDFYGLRYAGNLNSFVDWLVYYYGAAARNELMLLGDLVAAARKSGTTEICVADIGANVGNHTLFLSTVADRVFSFEPYPPVLAQLRLKIAQNGIANVTVLPYGLGDRDDMLAFFEPQAENHGVGSFIVGGHGQDASKALAIRHASAAFDAEAIPPVTVIKVDVEGFEHIVFAGLKDRLERDRPFILSELSAPTRKAVPDRAGFARLLPAGYEFAAVGTRSVSGPYRLDPFDYATTGEFLAYPAERQAILSALQRS